MSAFDVARFPLNIASPPADGKRRPAVVILHGNFGLSKDYAGRLIRFRDRLASAGYLAAVPRYYPDDLAHPDDRDPEPHVATVAAAIEEIAACPGADPDRMALVGYSLGGGVAMSYLIDHAPERMKAFVDFFGYYKQGRIPEGARLPPTAIFHDRNDGFVPFRLSLDLIRDLDPGVEVLIRGYVEQNAATSNHVFMEDGPADKDSLSGAEEWLKRYLPPADP